MTINRTWLQPWYVPDRVHGLVRPLDSASSGPECNAMPEPDEPSTPSTACRDATLSDCFQR